VISLIATLITILSISYTIHTLGSSPVDGLAELGAFQVTPVVVIAMLLFLIPLGMFFSSLLMAIGTFARTMKEGQSYMQPLVMLMIFPAVTSMMPGFELSWSTVWIPLVNTPLAIREIFIMNGEALSLVAAVFVYNLVLAGLGMFLTTRLYRREEVIFRV
jgi:sodium transport system permease protein